MVDPAILAKAKEGRGLTIAEQATLAAEVRRLQLAGHLEEYLRRVDPDDAVGEALRSWDETVAAVRQTTGGR